jgi:inorganic pyrophosphatase/exopolyphosphatase
VGNGAEELIRNAFHTPLLKQPEDRSSGEVDLPGVVSRKKQLVPAIMVACEA